ncbi:hypothetical protein BGX28_007252 [Mortierella sp. GBA30]|nr:hypothetical protein BGX28_007252 [Mortierella sp. GBA30]
MARNEAPEPRNRSNSLSAAWSFLWRGSNSKQQQLNPHGGNSTARSAKHQTIREEEDDDEDRVLGKGITRKVLPQQRRSTSSVPSSPAGSSRTSPRIEPKRFSAGKSKSPRPNSSFSTSPPHISPLGLGLTGIQGPQEPSSELLLHLAAPTSGPSYFDITPSSSLADASPSYSKKSSSGFTTKTPGRRTRRTPAHSISSTITNGGSSTPRRISCANIETASQNSTSYLDEQDLEIDENSFYNHLQKMQERYLAQQEPGWLRTQHAILQAKHKIPGSGSPGSPHRELSKGGLQGKKSSIVPGSHTFLSRIQSGGSSPSGSDYSSSPSFHPGLNQQRLPFSDPSSAQRHQPIQPYNCFQPGNVICVPRERSLGGLIFHKSFVDTHILTPSPYYRGQYLTLDHKVVEIDKEYVREISGFAHPRSVQILSEETVYNGSSQKPTRVLVLDRPLEGDGVTLSKPIDGLLMPSMRQFTSDMAFLESLPELSRALRDFNNLCQEFENTYVYIRGFAAYTLDKLRLIYEKAYRDCLGDSVKLQKMLMRGVQAEQDCFAELMENVVLGKLYQKLFVHSLVPCYAQRDVDVDKTIARYHRHLFSLGGHRGIDGGTCLASTDGPLLREALKKLGLSEKLHSMRVDHALEGAAGLFRAWDQESEDERSQRSMSISLQETEQEKKRRQLRESLRVFVQDDGMKAGKRSSIRSREDQDVEDEDEDPTADAVWNTPLEKMQSIKQALDIITAVAEDHLMHGQGTGFVQKKRSDVSVTTDDFIPLLALAIIQARMMRLGSNLFYLQRFRINAPKPDMSFALVTFEASVEFLKTDPLGLFRLDQTRSSSSAGFNPVSNESHSGSSAPTDIDHLSPTDDILLLPWGTPSHTGWGFSPPKVSSFTPALELLQPHPEATLTLPSTESSPSRPHLTTYQSDSSKHQTQQQQRHIRSTSVNIDDRFRRMTQAEEGGSGSSSNSSWSRSPLLGPRFTSGANSPLGATSPSYGIGSNFIDGTSSMPGRRRSHQLQPSPQRHSISSGQAHMHSPSSHLDHHRISFEQGRETMNRSTILPLQSPHMTPQLVVKPQIMLPPPKTPPMSGQNTSNRSRPMSMIVVGGLASSAHSNSYSGPSVNFSRNISYGSNQSSPATSPRLGPGTGNGQSSSRSNSLKTGPFPVIRANSIVGAVHKASHHSGGKTTTYDEPKEQIEPLSPVSPDSSCITKSLSDPKAALVESPVMSAVTILPSTADSQAIDSSNASRLGANMPNRIRTSPSSTTSSISTPTTPSTFSPANANSLLNSLTASAHLANPSTGSLGSAVSRRRTIHTPDVSSTSSSTSSTSSTSSAPSSVRSKHSSVGRQSCMRLSLPKLALSPSTPSTACSKTTVTAATSSSTAADILEPSPTVLTTGLLEPSVIPTKAAMGTKSAPEVPTLASLSQSGSPYQVRARSPAISMANSPFTLSDLGQSSLPSPVTPHSPTKEYTVQSSASWTKTDDDEHASGTIESLVVSAAEPQSSSKIGTPHSTPAPIRPVMRAASVKSSSLANSISSSPSHRQQHFQYNGRQTAPEIISLASPLTGSMVTPRTDSALPDGSTTASSSYTASLRDSSSRSSSYVSNNGGSYSNWMRLSLDGARPNSSQGCYGSNGYASSFGSSPQNSEIGLNYPHQSQSSLPSTPTSRTRPLHPLSLDLGHSHPRQPRYQYPHQRQYSESAAGVASSPYPSSSPGGSFGRHHESFGRGLGIHQGSFEPGVQIIDGGGGIGRVSHKESRHLSFPFGAHEYTRNPIVTISRIPEQKEEQDMDLSLEDKGTSCRDVTASNPCETAPSASASSSLIGDPVHQKMDSGKFAGQHGSQNSSSSSTVSARSFMDHVTHGTALDFERTFLEELNAEPLPISSQRRRESVASLRNAKSLSDFRSEQGQVQEQEHEQGQEQAQEYLMTISNRNVVEDDQLQGSQRGHRLVLSDGDLPSSSSAASSFTSHPITLLTGKETPTTPAIFIVDNTQQRATKQTTMMGDFLSELAKVNDGDVLVGNGQDGVLVRQ